MDLTDQRGGRVRLGASIGVGGEATVYAVAGDPASVGKVYHTSTTERIAKLTAMIANPPIDPTAALNHVSICWPRSVLMTPAGHAVGFLMPRLDQDDSVPVLALYNPQDRIRVAPGFTWAYLLRTGSNIVSVVEAIHARGYVIGDLNESNFLVSTRTLVTLVDCDSMQVPKPGSGGSFRCPVGKPEFTAPEIQGLDFQKIDRRPAQDNFALGVMLFQLLMEGTHPFSGVWRGPGDPPPLEERIRLGECAYVKGKRVSPMPGAPPFDLLPAALRSLVFRCFDRGHATPAARPSPHEWRIALRALEKNLATCAVNGKHQYSNHLGRCPWCERAALLGGLDPFAGGQWPLVPAPFARPAPTPQARPPALPAQSLLSRRSPPGRSALRRSGSSWGGLFKMATGVGVLAGGLALLGTFANQPTPVTEPALVRPVVQSVDLCGAGVAPSAACRGDDTLDVLAIQYANAADGRTTIQAVWSENAQVVLRSERVVVSRPNGVVYLSAKGILPGTYNVQILADGEEVVSLSLIVPATSTETVIDPSTLTQSPDGRDSSAPAPPVFEDVVYPVVHKHSTGSCRGELRLGRDSMAFISATSPNDSRIFSRADLRLDDDGVKDPSGRNWHFSVADMDKRQVHVLFGAWLTRH